MRAAIASVPSAASANQPGSSNASVLPRNSNQALGIGQFAVDFMTGTIVRPGQAVLDRTILFHSDAVLCGLSALALKTNAPTLLRDEALAYENAKGVPVFG